jgi:hypothetical protein
MARPGCSATRDGSSAEVCLIMPASTDPRSRLRWRRAGRRRADRGTARRLDRDPACREMAARRASAPEYDGALKRNAAPGTRSRTEPGMLALEPYSGRSELLSLFQPQKSNSGRRSWRGAPGCEWGVQVNLVSFRAPVTGDRALSRGPSLLSCDGRCDGVRLAQRCGQRQQFKGIVPAEPWRWLADSGSTQAGTCSADPAVQEGS